ncbi:dol-P-Glc:Glc(2)Man(9)GlcNAc(2)-PP-Dol alpha-1,2-glucosyltransferase [Anabrus simplex]|uniref:dol-P-Glc:Glc(2)Man(9)GlcNAc(2)-PP-Dol alpha-1,2-glucosyltransferase n=1 Tax=Anabrus simplex TaxID=316456 RepID=UPI0034DD2781
MAAKRTATNSKMHILIGGIVSFAFVCVSYCIFSLIYAVQPTPYLDEAFHVPQANNYCKGLFKEWDQKITTLPGLYLLSVGILKPLSWIPGGDFCGVYALRFINLMACFVNIFLLFALQRKLKQNKKDIVTFCSDLLSAINLGTFPILYFFTFLYYTDTVSTTLVLLMYLLHLENCHVMAAATGAVSVLVRQTNIIWVAFFGLLTAEQVFKKEIMQTRRRISSNMESSIRYLQILLDTVMHIWRSGNSACLHFMFNLLREVYSYVGVCICFVIFVIVNGGIVVGDKEAHTAVINLPQLLYFSMFTTFFSFPYFIKYIYPFVKCVFRYKRKFLFCFLILCVIVYFNTHVHPYLLADNRHYTFYLWRRVYVRHFTVKYILLPVSMYGIFCIFHTLKQTTIIFQLGYLVCVFLCLVPQKLLEFRYYILPFLLFRLQIVSKQWWQLAFEFAVFSFLNAATISLFVTREFYWDDRSEVQRFLW